ncbi:helix-turn-helix transcriptional regulator [Microbacterium sp. 1.5R]|uniref:helix-turn-helix transcriptional regulator n=1 Tax=Microbacterium sp. 1.5R TaxID=1916917 RepID=UPI00119EF11B|nr:helix-turn-helix transcriptional regulator [Microbacterium sp. 1.5R]
MPTDVSTFSSDDIEEVEARLCEQYGSVDIGSADGSLREERTSTDRFSLTRGKYSGSFTATTEAPALSAMVAHGHHHWSTGGELGDSQDTPLLVRPGVDIRASWGATDFVVFTYDIPALERSARMLYGDDRLTVRFASGLPADRARGRYFHDLLASTVTYAPLLRDSELLQTSLHRMMAAALLECFAPSADPARRSDSVCSQQEGYRRARAFIDEHASEPITVDDIAAAASLSVRQLDDAVRSFSSGGVDAAAELRRARLDGAHRDLIRGDPTRGDTVGAIALRWGFAPSNFARAYRTTHGASPRQTLNR